MIVKGDEELEMISDDMNRFSETTDAVLISADQFLKRRLYQEGVEEGIEKGIERGMEKGIMSNVINMIKYTNLNDELIAKCSNLSINEVKKLRVDNNNITL